MDSVSREQLTDAIKVVTRATLEQLEKCNFRGTALAKQGLMIAEVAADHGDQILAFLKILAPLFEFVGEWVKEMLSHLWDVFSWAKALWDSMFGHTTKTA